MKIAVIAFSVLMGLGACSDRGTFYDARAHDSNFSAGNTAVAVVGGLIAWDIAHQSTDQTGHNDGYNGHGTEDWTYDWDYVAGYGWYCRGITTERLAPPQYCTGRKVDRRWPNY